MDPELERLRGGLAPAYDVLDLVGEGGMALVFRARDVRHDRFVAIKVLRPVVAAAIGPERFLREIRIEAGLQHPHIVPVLDSGEVDGLLYYVMPLLNGESLRQRIDRESRLRVADVLEIARQLASALGHAHAKGVVHRDVKPGNVLLEGTHVWLADFGIARGLAAADHSVVTSSGIIVGTPAYMSPEQASGASPIDGRSDVYSFGCVVYEMLTGEPPFTGNTAQAVIARHLAQPVGPVEIVRPGIPRPMGQAVLRALAKTPADRFETAPAFAEALQAGSIARSWRPWRVMLATAALAALAWAIWPETSRLEPRRVAVFNLELPPESLDDRSGEQLATLVGYALEQTEPLVWIDGGSFLPAQDRLRSHSVPELLGYARRIGAGSMVRGTVVRIADSTVVSLELFDVSAGRLLSRSSKGARQQGTEVATLALKAIPALIAPLLDRNVQVDASLATVAPAALVHFMVAESEFRRFRIRDALAHYRAAVGADSSFSLAAVMGALASRWLHEEGESQSRELAAAAHRGSGLSPRFEFLARGLSHYVNGDADSALAALHGALAIDPEWARAGLIFAEVNYHLIPKHPEHVREAAAAFSRLLGADSVLPPALYHSVEIALRAGHPDQARRLLDRLERVDSTDSHRELDLLLACARDPTQSDWTRQARGSPRLLVYAAAAGGIAMPACATAGFRAVLADSQATVEDRWGAALGLFSLLVGRSDRAGLRDLFSAPELLDLPVRLLSLLAVAAGISVDSIAEQAVTERRSQFASMGLPTLWLFGTWAAATGRPDILGPVTVVARRQADSTRAPSDQLIADALEAHAVLLRGDSTAALTRLARLRPRASASRLQWDPWESLAFERLTEARVLLAQDRLAEAIDAAAALDSPGPVIFSAFLRGSLEIRIAAARRLGRASDVVQLERRLESLTR